LTHHELLQRSDYESGGQEFESLRARQSNQALTETHRLRKQN
jgi:hypothetical protein